MTKTEILKAKVINFLVENDAYSSFMEEVPNEWSDNLDFDSLIEYACMNDNERSFFDMAIEWDETTDGQDFWQALHRKFRETYASISCELSDTTEIPNDQWANMWEE